MPTRTSMRALSNIWTNPYGANQSADEGVDDTTAYHLELLAEERARLENEKMAEQNRQLRALSPEAKRLQQAEDLNYDVGLFRSPLGYEGRRMLDTQAEEAAARMKPVWEQEVRKATAPWGADRAAIEALKTAGNIDIQRLRNMGSLDVASTRGGADLLSRLIQGGFQTATERERQLGGIYREGAGMNRDPNEMARGFTNAPRPTQGRGNVSLDEVLKYAAETRQSVDAVLRDLIGNGYQIQTQ